MPEALSWQDYGLTGLIIGPILGTFIWWIRAARSDLNDAHHKFTAYLQDTAGKQTEALVSVGNALQRSIEASQQHEDRANRRHQQVMSALGKTDLPDV